MSTVAESSVAVRDFVSADEAAVVDLLQRAFGFWPRALPGAAGADFFRWKHFDCPFGRSVTIVAEEHGEIIGFLGRLPWPMRLGGRPVVAIRGVDLAVDPAWRRRGVSLALMRAVIEREPASVVLNWNNPNRLSRGGLLQVGRRRPLSVPRFAALGQGPTQRLRGALGRRTRASEGAVSAPSAAEVLSDEAFVSHLLGELPVRASRLETDRSVSYLRWRYGHFETYHAVRIDEHPHQHGLAIFRLRRRRSFSFCEVCELLATDDRVARELLASVKRSARADILCCLFPSRLQAARCGVLGQLGAIELTVRPGAGYEGLPAEPKRRRSWGLSLGDLELL
jgi:GNAT superfamily N-acetyltransferase